MMLKNLQKFLRDEAAVIKAAKTAAGAVMLAFCAVRFDDFGAVAATGIVGAALTVGYICTAVWLISRLDEENIVKDKEI